MNITKTLSLVAAAGAIASDRANAQDISFDFQSTSFANYRQLQPPGAPEQTFFEAGAFGVSIRDGNAVFSPPNCRGFEFFPPSLVCPIGATGLITFGDVDGDGIQDPGEYFSITDIFRASIIQQFAATSARLVSAPPSRLPRPLSGFVDTSATLFFNLQSAFIERYDIARMSLNRTYAAGERTLFDEELVPGTYRFNFQRLINPDFLGVTPPVVLELNIFPPLDAFREKNNTKQGFRFKNVTYQDGFAIIDPLELNILEWEGNTVSFISPAADSLFISIKPLTDPSDPFSDPVAFDGNGTFLLDEFGVIVENEFGTPIANPTLPLFPNFLGPNTTRVFIPNPLVQSYILPPNVIAPGQTGVLDLEFILDRPTTAVISDRSTRRFRLPVIIVNRFTTAIAGMLPATATPAQLEDDADYDGDGASNFAEWAFGSNPADAKSSPYFAQSKAPEKLISVATRNGEVETNSQAALKYEVRKLKHTEPPLQYSIEFSTDMVKWDKVTEFDPRFVITETDDLLTVETAGAPPEGGGFFRSKVQTK